MVRGWAQFQFPMKTSRRVWIAALLGAVCVQAAPADAVVAGPKGGRLLETTPLRAEFFVTPEQRAEVVFYDDALQPVAPATQVVAITAEAPAGRVALELETTATGFVTRGALPDGAPYRVVVQVRAAPGERPQNFRIDLDLAHCGGCDRTEYACTCEGH